MRQLTGADHVVSLGWMMRRTGAERGGALPPAPDVHTDLHTCAIARHYAEVHARSPLPPEGSYRRAVYTSLWRAFSPPPQDWPLALCDYRSVDDAEGQPNLLFRVRELPAAQQANSAADDDQAESAASVFAYRPAHRWWYFPGMHAGEALVIKLHDTDHSVAWRAPHTSFHDTTATGAHPRESVELRTVAFFALGATRVVQRGSGESSARRTTRRPSPATMAYMAARRALFTGHRGIAALMAVEAASLAVASGLHLSGAGGHGATAAGIAEAVICLVLLGGTIAYQRASWGKPAAIAATGFAIAGFCYGLSVTARGGYLPDIVYHATVLPLLAVTMILIVRAKAPAAPPAAAVPALVSGPRRG